MRKAVFFDKDGVINSVVMRSEQIGSPRCFNEFHLVQHAAPVIRSLKRAGFFTALVTNQPDIERGLMELAELNRMLQVIRNLGIDHIEVCFASSADDPRKKPNPGMILDMARKNAIDLSQSYLVGDTGRDMAAAQAAGITSVLLKSGYNQDAEALADCVLASLLELPDWLATQRL